MAPVRVALPKGRLDRVTAVIVRALDLASPVPRALRLADPEMAVWGLKMRDIPQVVAAGDVDIAVASDEWIEESGVGELRVTSLATGRTDARLSVLVPREHFGRPRPAILRVATEFPSLARRHLAGHPGDVHIRKV